MRASKEIEGYKIYNILLKVHNKKMRILNIILLVSIYINLVLWAYILIGKY